MDIYSFIRSKDVATHCRNIGKTWNTCEMAVIIDRSNLTIADKHAAWLELIEHYPDMPAIMPNYHEANFDSVHKMIAERIDYDQHAIKWFKTPENGACYTYAPSDFLNRFWSSMILCGDFREKNRLFSANTIPNSYNIKKQLYQSIFKTYTIQQMLRILWNL